MLNLRLPKFSNDNVPVQQTLAVRLKDAGCQFSDLYHPFQLPGFKSDFRDIPDFGLCDVFNYLICYRADYNRRKLCTYKSFHNYRLFSDDHVLDIKVTSAATASTNCCSASCSSSDIPERKGFFIFRAEVKPLQDRTYLKKDMYSSWIVLHTESADIKTAYCECPGG